ncbi:alpha/beta fold hydrolase, partial [Acinetobacter baumannii]
IDRLSPHRVVDFIAYPEHQPLGYQELLDLVLPTLPAGRFVVLGESFGGPLAVEIAARFKERVAGLILAATYVRPPLPS